MITEISPFCISMLMSCRPRTCLCCFKQFGFADALVSDQVAASPSGCCQRFCRDCGFEFSERVICGLYRDFWLASIRCSAALEQRSSTTASKTMPKPGDKADAQFKVADAAQDQHAKARRRNQRGDHDHRKAHHDRLVHACHDVGQRQRQLHANQLLSLASCQRHRRPRSRRGQPGGCPRSVRRMIGTIA